MNNPLSKMPVGGLLHSEPVVLFTVWPWSWREDAKVEGQLATTPLEKNILWRAPKNPSGPSHVSLEDVLRSYRYSAVLGTHQGGIRSCSGRCLVSV